VHRAVCLFTFQLLPPRRNGQTELNFQLGGELVGSLEDVYKLAQQRHYLKLSRKKCCGVRKI